MTKYHKEQIEIIDKQLHQLKTKSNILFWGKILSFIGTLTMLYFCFTNTGTMMVIATILLATAYCSAYVYDSKLQHCIDKLCTLHKLHENEINALRGDFSAFPRGEEFVDKSHPYSFDLDIFGKGSLFNRVCRCTTYIGRRRLAKMMQTIQTDPKTIRQRMEAISELGRNEKHIEFIESVCTVEHTEGRITDITPLLSENAYKEKEGKFSSWQFHLLWTVPLCLFWSVVLMWALDIIPASIVTLFFMSNLAYMRIYRHTLKRMFKETSQLRKEFRGYAKLLRIIEKQTFTSSLLKDRFNTLFKDKGNATEALHRLNQTLTNVELRDNFVMYLICDGLFLAPPLLIRHFIKWKETHLQHISEWVDAIADFDAMASLGYYTFNHPTSNFANPQTSKHFHIEAQGLYHPFLPSDKAVSNDFTQSEKELFIITGANMAGKSTMLRSVGISMVMASCGLPLCAEKFDYTPTLLFSNMRTSDDLNQNISYFNAELNRLKQLITFCKQNEHTFIILDEILKGTNSEDKLKGSVKFLRHISQMPVTGIVATHDLAISSLEDENKAFKNFCFEIDMSENVNYSYKMTRGVARNMNATYLLDKILV